MLQLYMMQHGSAKKYARRSISSGTRHSPLSHTSPLVHVRSGHMSEPGWFLHDPKRVVCLWYTRG